MFEAKCLLYINFINSHNLKYINDIVSKKINNLCDLYYYTTKKSNNGHYKTCFIDSYISNDLNKNEYDLYHKTAKLKNIDIDKIINKTFFIEYHNYMLEYKIKNSFTQRPLEKFVTNNNNVFYNNDNLNIETEYFQNFIKDIVNIINNVYNCNMTIYNVKPKFIEIIHIYIMKNFDLIYDMNNSNISYIFKSIVTDVTCNFLFPTLSNKKVN